MNTKAPPPVIDRDYTCSECGHTANWNRLNDISGIHDRVLPGELMPVAECPKCEALIAVEDDQVIE